MTLRLSVLMLVMACAVPATSAAAQTAGEGSGTARPTRAYRGLFGPDDRDDRRPARWVLNGLVYIGADDTASLSGDSVLDEPLQSARMHEGVQVTLAYLRKRSRTTVTAELTSAVRHYPRLQSIGTQKHRGRLTAQWMATPRLVLHAGAPSGGELTTSGDIDYSVTRQKQMTFSSIAGATYAVSLARELSVSYSRQDTFFFAADDFHSQRAAFQLLHRLSPALQLRTGYALTAAALGRSDPVQHHDLDLGIDYSRAVVSSPRTAVGFTTGSSIVGGGGLQLTGGVHVRHLLAERWTSTVAWQRGLRSLEYLARPFAVDTVNGELSGFVNARVRLRVMPVWTRGQDAVTGDGTYRSTSNQVRVDIAATRHWAAYMEHFYYCYAFAGGAETPAFLARGMKRQGLRWGLTLWAPVAR
jgi:hypothetical protein